MSRNKERVGAEPGAGAQIPAIPQAELNQGAKLYEAPTEAVELPSQGRFYPKSHPLHGKTFIEIKFMTATEEDLLTSRSLIKKGIAIDRMLESIIIDKNIVLNDLLLGDKNALIVASRITGYGADYDVRTKCPACKTSQKTSFDLANLETNHGSCDGFKAKYDDGEPSFEITLPKTGARLRCKMMTGKDEFKLSELAQARQKQKLREAPLTDQMKTYIVSVDGNHDREYISKFAEHMPASDSKYLRTAYSKIVPNILMKQNMECNNPDCGEVTEVVVPFTTEFFWPE